MKGNFLLIDPQRNTVMIPAYSKYIAELLREIGSENVHTHDTKKELIAEISEYLKEESK